MGLSKEQRMLISEFMKSGDYNVCLKRLHETFKPIMSQCMRVYLMEIPYLDREDYYQIGMITLWRVLERVKVNEKVLDDFVAYYYTSLKHDYLRELDKYVMKNDKMVFCWETEAGYNVSSLLSYEQYRQSLIDRRRKYRKKYRNTHKRRKKSEIEKEKIREYKRAYYKKNKERIVQQRNRKEVKEKIRERNKRYREKNKEKIAIMKHEYYLQHRDEILRKEKEYRCNKKKKNINE